MTLIEFLILISVVLILTGTFGRYMQITLKIAKEEALTNELKNIRMAIEYYRIVNSRLPKDLAELMNKRLTSDKSYSKITQNKFLEPFRLDKKGFLLDPFMHRYIYDAQKGRVNSPTKGYETW